MANGYAAHMNATYGPCEVTLHGSLEPDGEVVKKAKITFLGESPNALCRLYKFVETDNRFKCIDTIGAASVEETGDDGSEFTVTGVSQQLVEEVGLTEKDAVVKWVVTVKGCETC